MDNQKLLTLLELVGIDRLIVRSNGWISGLCPFHKESNPSFGINTREPYPFNCFGCGAKGVLRNLLEVSGKFKKKEIKAICADVEDTRGYLFKDFDKEEKRLKQIDYRLLFPYSAHRKLFRYLRSRGIPDWTSKKTGCLYDRTQQRVLFPWYLHGLLVGVTGRSVDSKNKVRIIPYFGTRKGQALYLPSGKIDVGGLTLVEGEVGAQKVFASGFPNVAALGFGAFTEEQQYLVLKSPATWINCFFDDDETGQRLTKKVVDVFKNNRRVSGVNYEPFRCRYSKKLDPGELTRRDIRQAMKTLISDIYWPTF